MRVRLLAARCARGFAFRCPSQKEGAGNAGCALHPRSRVQKATNKSAHEHTGSAEAIRHSLRNGFTAYAVISPTSEFVLSPSLPACPLIESGWIDFATDSLAPATGVRTRRFCRTRIAPFVCG